MKSWNARNLSTILAGLAAIAVLVPGCATPIEVAFDEREDLSPYRTWSWARESGARVYAPHGDAVALEARMSRYIEERLAAKGFRRVRVAADFVVSYQLAFERRSVVGYRPRAAYQLSSHSSAPSFVVEGSEAVTRVYQALHLAIGVREPRGRALWRAELRQNGEETFSLTLQGAVATLLERLPKHEPGPPCNASSKRSGAADVEREVDAEIEGRCPPTRPRAPRPSPSRLPAATLG